MAGDALAAEALDLVFVRLAASRGLRVDPSPAVSSPSARSRAAAALAAVDFAALDVEDLGAAHEALLGCAVTRTGAGVALVATDDRRRAGAHYTARPLAASVVRDTLAPLLAENDSPAAILALTVCDPAMGAGAFLLAVCRALGDALAAAWRAEGARAGPERSLERAARGAVAARCLYGVDRDARAVAVARRSLWIEAGGEGDPADFLGDALREGDALVGARSTDPRERAEAERAAAAIAREEGRATRCVHWPEHFAEVFAGGGFAAVVGNPPWVSYAGRAAQPLATARRRWFGATFGAFARYRNLQGLFVERAAGLLAPGGRLGLVLPSSMAELEGYGPTRAAHDRFAACDPTLTDLGERGFAGVFQPAMVLRATARPSVLPAGDGRPWPLERPDLDDEARSILARLDRPPLPPETFGERGLHTAGDDTDHLRNSPDAHHTVPLRVGSDVTAGRRGPPSQWADPRWFGARIRGAEAWAAVAVLIRQTARVPVAARSDGGAFRNSLLAGFATADFPAGFLVAYLNATPLRWWHYHRHRDARLGMPQVKIGHLRAIPAPPAVTVRALDAIGEALAARNEGVSEEVQRAIDEAVADAFGLTADERARVARDAPRWR